MGYMYMTNTPKGDLKICSRGHQFYKSSGCPTCPVCWPGRYEEIKRDFPETLSAPALRALANADISSLSELTKYTEGEILALHGMGPKAMRELKLSMHEHGLLFLEGK